MNILSSKNIAVVFLSLFAFLGNYFSVPMFFGVDFLFGSIFVLIAALLLGWQYAIPVVLLSALYTVSLWGHPYALIIFTLEAAFVWWVSRRWTTNVIVADALYWLFVGAPLVWIFYSWVMGMDPEQVKVIVLKQPVNGLFNAVIAMMLILALPTNWIRKFSTKRIQITAKSLVAMLLFTGMFFSTLAFIVYQSQVNIVQLQNELEQTLSHRAELIRRLESAQPERYTEKVVRDLFESASVESGKETIHVLTHVDMQHIRASKATHITQVKGPGTIRKVSDSLYQWLPERGGKPNMAWWRSSRYIYLSMSDTIGGSDILIDVSAKPVVDRLHRANIEVMIMLLIFSLIGGALSLVAGHAVSRSLRKLASLSKDLPAKLTRGETQFDWPESNIQEIANLSANSNLMTAMLNDTLSEIKSSRLVLEQRVAERTAKLSEVFSRTRSIIEHAADAIVTVDEGFCVVDCNPAAIKMFGYSLPEIQHRDLSSLFTALTKDSFGELVKPESVMEFSGVRSNGDVFPAEIVVTYFNSENIRFFSIFCRDISERKKVERMKSEFISTINHELRTPLTAIQGAVSLLGNFVEKKENTENLLDVALRNCSRLRHLVDDLLDMQRLETGSLRFEMDEFVLRDLILKSIDSSKMISVSNDISVQLLGQISDNTIVEVDDFRFLQVMSNLLSNAIKFSKKGGQIGVEVLVEDNASVIISVTDNGRGIPAHFVPHVFEKFAQADASDTRDMGGTGLGLNITRSIVNQMNGEIWFESEPSVKTVFYIKFPCRIGMLEQ